MAGRRCAGDGRCAGNVRVGRAEGFAAVHHRQSDEGGDRVGSGGEPGAGRRTVWRRRPARHSVHDARGQAPRVRRPEMSRWWLRSSRISRSARRSRRAWGALLSAVAVGSLIGTLHAADPERALSQYIRDRWDSSNGFPGGHVYAITQTRDGYLWIAAENGLARFDGLSYRLFKPVEPTSRSDAAVLNLVPDPDGGLWIWLRRAAMQRFNNGVVGTALQVPGPPAPRIAVLSPGNNGAILIAERQLGLMIARGGRVDTVVAGSALPRSFATSLAQTPDGDVWIGTRDSGLVRVRGGQVTPVAGALLNPKINCLMPDERGGVWIGSDEGVFRWNTDAATQAGVPRELGHVQALAMIRDRDANVWVGTADGLFRVDRRGVASVDRHATAAAVDALFEDRE